MRIAFLTKRFPPETCGVGDFTARLAETCAAAGHEVVVFTATPGAASLPAAQSAVRVVELPLRGWRDVRGALRAIRAAQPDVLHLEYSSYGWGRWGVAPWVNALVGALRLGGVRVTIAFHELSISLSWQPRLLLAGLAQRAHIGLLLLTATGIVTNTPGRIAQLRARLAWKRGRIHYRPNASNIPVTPQSESGRAARRARMGAAPDCIVVATFGNFASAKNYEAVIAAVARLREKHDARLWLLGDWGIADAAYIARLRAQITAAALDNVVFWSGRCAAEEISALLFAADVFVLPQPDGHLTRSGAFMAAAAHGLPAIAIRNAENQTEFAHGTNVWLVAGSDAAEFAVALAALAGDAELRRGLGANLRALYESRFDWPRLLPAGVPPQTADVTVAKAIAARGRL